MVVVKEIYKRKPCLRRPVDCTVVNFCSVRNEIHSSPLGRITFFKVIWANWPFKAT